MKNAYRHAIQKGLVKPVSSRDAKRANAFAAPDRFRLDRGRTTEAFRGGLTGWRWPTNFSLTCPATGEACPTPYLCRASECHK